MYIESCNFSFILRHTLVHPRFKHVAYTHMERSNERQLSWRVCSSSEISNQAIKQQLTVHRTGYLQFTRWILGASMKKKPANRFFGSYAALDTTHPMYECLVALQLLLNGCGLDIVRNFSKSAHTREKKKTPINHRDSDRFVLIFATNENYTGKFPTFPKSSSYRTGAATICSAPCIWCDGCNFEFSVN